MMNRSVRMLLAIAGLMGLRAEASEVEIHAFRLRTPGGASAIQQGSGLHYGRLGEREGLWLVCDRNGEHSAGKIYYIARKTLDTARPGAAIVADAEISILPPTGEWAAFAEAHHDAGAEALADIRERVTRPRNGEDAPHLDLEAITIAPSPRPSHEPRIFVVSEEPHSVVLELKLEASSGAAGARLVGLYAYAEDADEQGTARNDGLEGLAWAGRPGVFYFAEEGTRSHTAETRPVLMFRDPRLGIGTLKAGRLEPDRKRSDALTARVRARRKGDMQTLNGLTALPDGRLLAVDRNGGLILCVDPAAGTAEPWLDLYALDGRNLRQLLAEFPHPRRMPYISIEGIAVDSAGAVWLVDDPAIPEGWRESCMVRLRGVRP